MAPVAVGALTSVFAPADPPELLPLPAASLVPRLERMCCWNICANGLVFTALRTNAGKPTPALGAFQHVLETELTWLRRIQADGDAGPLWGEASLELCEAWSTEENRPLRMFCEHVDAAYLQSTFSYRNSRGESFSDRLEEPLIHCLLHSQQHRPQRRSTPPASASRTSNTYSGSGEPG
jgi:hypothetical protein